MRTYCKRQHRLGRSHPCEHRIVTLAMYCNITPARGAIHIAVSSGDCGAGVPALLRRTCVRSAFSEPPARAWHADGRLVMCEPGFTPVLSWDESAQRYGGRPPGGVRCGSFRRATSIGEPLGESKSAAGRTERTPAIRRVSCKQVRTTHRVGPGPGAPRASG